MLFSEFDIELLKLAAMNKIFPLGVGTAFHTRLLSRQEIQPLISLGALRLNRAGNLLRPSPSAYDLLEGCDLFFHRDSRPQNKASLLQRRVHSFYSLLTFYRAGAYVFGEGSDFPIVPETGSYISAVEIRRARNNALGSTSFYGIYFSGGTAYMLWDVGGSKGVYLQNEIRIFNSIVEEVRRRTGQEYTRAGIFMGASVGEIEEAVFGEPGRNMGRKNEHGDTGAAFHKAFNDIALPIHFLPIGDDGARQLKLMQMPGYPEVAARAVMGDTYRPPYEAMPDTDTVHPQPPHVPVVMAFDMDIKRTSRALSQAREGGFEQICIVAAPEQTPFLTRRYGEDGLAAIHTVTWDTLFGAVSGGLPLYEPSDRVFTHNNRRINVSLLNTHRKTGSAD
ncbi:hypothetical protein LJC32_03700 [Oscillospiraceae bacterium OttesenSCG-928-F05]|nr:hypothetical protein [Oscillospiraceae bacterium OttesenSCG-928-F05]